MNVQMLNDKLIDNSENIIKILTGLKHENITDRGKYITFSNYDGDNLNGCSILKSNLSYQNFSRGRSGNIYTLVMEDLECEFPKSLNFIAKILNIEGKNYQIKYPFHAFYKSILKEQNEPEYSLKTYKENVMPAQDSFSKLFIDDGISLDAQLKFGVRYCHEDDCVLIPIYNLNNELVGVKARNNSNEDYNNRWYAWIPYSKSYIVYGINWNYKEIIKKKTLIIFESEKSVMKAYECGLNCTCAIAGHNISEAQARIIKSLMVENIIVAFDESICEDEIIYESKKLLTNTLTFKNKVSYLFDKDNKYLPKGQKDSPIDLGKDILNSLLKNCRYYIGEKNE